MIYFISPAYISYPILIPSLICQSSPRWKARICHDGPNPEYANISSDPRIELQFTPQRTGAWGHYIRKLLIDTLICDDDDLVVVTNHDNVCLPNLVAAIEYLKEDFIAYGAIHNYFDYFPLYPKLEYAKIDVSMVAVRARIVKQVSWPSFVQDSDFIYLQKCWQESKSWNFLTKILSVHN